MGKRTCSLWATDTGRLKENRQISTCTFHSTGGALCLSFIVNIVLIYRVSIQVKVRVRVCKGLTVLVYFYFPLSLRPCPVSERFRKAIASSD